MAPFSLKRGGKVPVQLRRYNERLILKTLRRMGEASKAELARAANLTNTAVGSIVDSLAKDGLLLFGGKRHDGQRGQPATLYHLNPDGVHGIGIRICRGGIETALIDFDGAMLSRINHDFLLPKPEEALDIVCNDVTESLKRLPSSKADRLAGIGLAQPYNLGSWLFELGLPPEVFHLWDQVDFASELEERVGIPVFFENDGTAAAIAELFYGIGRENDHFLYLFIGPAIGGGVVLNGECLNGVSNNAGDVAFMPVPPSNLPSAPKSTGVWDSLLSRASLNALLRHLRFHGFRVETKAELTELVRRDNRAVDEWLDDCIEALAPSVRAGHAILDVPLVVIDADVDGGLICRLKEKLEAALLTYAAEARPPPRVVIGSFRGNAGAIGAASLPMFFCFSPYLSPKADLTGQSG